jgi:hypothetical protein
MLWKNIVMLVVLSWMGSTYAAHPIVAEDMGDVLIQRYEETVEQKKGERTIAEEGKKPSDPSEPQEVEMKYWRWSDSPTN